MSEPTLDRVALLQQQIEHQAQSIDGYREAIRELGAHRGQLARQLAAYREPVKVTLSRENAIMLAGWIQAHRPPGDWEPEFLGMALRAIKNAVHVPDPADDEEPF